MASSPNERRAILQSYIEPTEEELEHGRKAPNAGHRAIVQMVRHGSARIIVTTNFHRLIENALCEQGVEPTIVASVNDQARSSSRIMSTKRVPPRSGTPDFNHSGERAAPPHECCRPWLVKAN